MAENGREKLKTKTFFICLGMTIVVCLCNILLMVWTRRETERMVYADLANFVARRAPDQFVFWGFDEGEAERLNRIPRQYRVDPRIAAAIYRHENGWKMCETGYNSPIPKYIRRQYHNPRDWPIAAMCDSVSRYALKFAQRPENIHDFFIALGSYNNGPQKANWSAQVEELYLGYLACRRIPSNKPVKPAKQGRKE